MIITLPQEHPFRGGRVYGDRFVIQLKDLFPGKKKNIIAIGDDIPDIGKRIILLQQQPLKGSIDQLPVLIR
jgi:hypothetical protein